MKEGGLFRGFLATRTIVLSPVGTERCRYMNPKVSVPTRAIESIAMMRVVRLTVLGFLGCGPSAV